MKEKIVKLINSKDEGNYWDFKEKWYENNARLLHDIICLANNLTDEDGIIIFGVRDKTFDIIGIENDSNRKNQQNVIDFLKNIDFASSIRPTIELKEISIENKKLDILRVKNDKNTPYFLKNDYRDNRILVKANYIYTRVQDTNTPINRSADINHVEYLWKKRFLLTSSPIKRIFKELEQPENWKESEYDNETVYYNIYNPEYTLSLIPDDNYDGVPEYYAYNFSNKSVRYGEIIIKYFNTKVYSKQYVVLDGGRYLVPTPEWNFIHEKPFANQITYKSYLKNSEVYIIFNFLNYLDNNSEELYYRNTFFETILIFENEEERINFNEYIKANFKAIFNEINEKEKNISVFETKNELEEADVKNKLATVGILHKKLKSYRKEWNANGI